MSAIKFSKGFLALPPPPSPPPHFPLSSPPKTIMVKNQFHLIASHSSFISLIHLQKHTYTHPHTCRLPPPHHHKNKTEKKRGKPRYIEPFKAFSLSPSLCPTFSLAQTTQPTQPTQPPSSLSTCKGEIKLDQSRASPRE